ncbi:MAG: cyclic nucleotide-binding domain-containing protein [Deltaproteobacteria bacterium]|nr:cyclic nucleotide-binding domain-containing protein [Deltaproteobacteria bacterium]
MLKILGKWLKVYEDEISLFFWVVLLLFLIRTSSILFNNFAETAFLKRYGVEYLPIVNVVNSISTFFIMGFLTGLMAKIPGSRMLGNTLLFCGVSVAALRFVVPLGFDLIYPVLYILKAQYEVLLALIFWNLANDLFNTRQSKRLFPLITAGGVVGGIIGSFATPPLAKAITMDNLMFAYLITTSLGAFMVRRMGKQFPTLLVSDKKGKKGGKKTNIVQDFKNVLPLMKKSTLVKVLILLTLLPNIVIPIMNYQFAYSVNQTFATQNGMLSFFGYFRGCMNIVSLIILLFVGRLYGRLGLPVVLMFHPINYMIAFLAFLLRFDIFSAMYARISTNILRTTMNNPARAILMGLFPVSYRAVIRPFLRGTVVRVGILIGSGIIMVSEGLYPPRYLSIAAMIFVGAWIMTTFVLKKSYPRILLDLISNNMLDLKSLEEKDADSVFADKSIRNRLLETFLASKGEDCLWHARILKAQNIENLDAHILRVLDNNDDKTKIELLAMLSPEAGDAAIARLRELVDPEKMDLTIAVVQAANRLSGESAREFCGEVFETIESPDVRAYAVVGLYNASPGDYEGVIDAWLNSRELAERRAGIIASGKTGHESYIPKLKEMLSASENEDIIQHLLDALHSLKMDAPNSLVMKYLTHPAEQVRLAALKAFELNDDDALRMAVILMDDVSEEIHDLAKEKILNATHQNPMVLVESLNIPRRRVREGIFSLLESLNIKDLELYRFARSQLEACYNHLLEIEGVNDFPESQGKELLLSHLNDKIQVELETILRVLATEDRTGQMRIIWRGIFSSDKRARSNSLEALDDSMDKSLSSIMLPLLESENNKTALAVGRKKFKLPRFEGDQRAFCSHLLQKDDWVILVLTLFLLLDRKNDILDEGILKHLAESENSYVRQMALKVMNVRNDDSDNMEEGMETEITIPDKILRLKGINIFEGLSVSELAAIASVTEELECAKDEFVIKEGEAGETMFLIINGAVSVLKGVGVENSREIELARIGVGDYFGEMALFEDAVRSASIKASEDSRFLVLHKQEFTEIVREYPQIALHICKALSGRMRDLHEKLQNYEK